MQAPVRLKLSDETATTSLARALEPSLHAGDCILLSGPIGAGKTQFARALIQKRLAALGRTEDVPSPTYTLVQTYDGGDTEIWHADLYRLGEPDEVIELGLDDAIANAITLIEWPDRLGDSAPPRALRIDLAIDGAGRTALIRWADPRLAGWIEAFEGAPA